MTTINTIAKANKLTQNEKEVLNFLNEELACQFGDYFSDVTFEDVAKGTSKSINEVKGIVSSLLKKRILGVQKWGDSVHTIEFRDQEDMDYEKMI